MYLILNGELYEYDDYDIIHEAVRRALVGHRVNYIPLEVFTPTIEKGPQGGWIIPKQYNKQPSV